MKLLQNFEAILRTAAEGLGQIPAETLSERPGPDRWSGKEVLGQTSGFYGEQPRTTYALRVTTRMNG